MTKRVEPTVKFNALARIERNARRAGEILGVLAKYGLADWVKGWNYSWIQERIQSYDGQRIPDLNIGERVRDGTFSVHLDHRHLDPVINRLVLGVMTSALFVGSSLLWSMKTPPVLAGVSIFGAAGYVVAAYLGLRLLRAIKKSGDITSRK